MSVYYVAWRGPGAVLHNTHGILHETSGEAGGNVMAEMELASTKYDLDLVLESVSLSAIVIAMDRAYRYAYGYRIRDRIARLFFFFPGEFREFRGFRGLVLSNRSKHGRNSSKH